jgi:hypothetical protein
VDLVTEAVKKRINKLEKSAEKNGKKEAERLKTDLTKWKALVEPLAYCPGGENGGHSTLKLVIRLVVEKVEDMQYGLNMAKPKSSLTYTEFGAKLYAMGRRSEPEAMGAPVMPKGSMAALLPLAVKKLSTIGGCTAATEAAYIINIFALCASVVNINFVPWHSGSLTGARRTLLPRHDFWVTIEKGNTSNIRPQATSLIMMDKQNPASASQEGSQYMAKHDSNTPWRGCISFSEMACLKNKNGLPEDWLLAEASINVERPKDPFVHEVYLWARDNYDGQNWKHKLAMVFGIFFSKMVPFVFCDKEVRKEVRESLGESRNMGEITSTIRALDWNETARACGVRGAKGKQPYITMASTYIMAWIDPSSPLRVYAGDKRGAIPSPWAHKHGER